MNHVMSYWRYKDTTSRFPAYTFLYLPCLSILFYAINIITTSFEHERNDCFWTRIIFLNTNLTNIFLAHGSHGSHGFCLRHFEHEIFFEHESHEYFLAHGSHGSHGFLPSALWTRDFFWTRISRITRICASRYCSRWIINPWDPWDPCAKNIRVIREIRVQKNYNSCSK